MAAASLLLALASPSVAQPLDPEQYLPHSLEVYRWFHQHPELSLNEKQTAARLAQELRAIGMEVETGIGGHGLVALLRGRPGGPVVLYRADMDALPIQEKTGLSYASVNTGVMHACGHDLHMSCAVATLSTLAAAREQWAGTVVFVGQPAEEVGAGARAMLADPRFTKLLQSLGSPPTVGLALHDDATLPAGQVALTPGFVTANVDSVDITMHGVGGHGAAPDKGIDPIVMACDLVGALQTIVSRKLPPGTRAVVTVGSFQAGTKRNIIPPQAELQLTVRSYEQAVREKILTEIERTANGVAAAYGATVSPTFHHHREAYTPAGVNDSQWVTRLRPAFARIVGESNLIDLPPSMVGEDFSRYGEALGIPTVMFMLGASPPGSDAGLHSDRFYPDIEPALRTGSKLMVAAILEALENSGSR